MHTMMRGPKCDMYGDTHVSGHTLAGSTYTVAEKGSRRGKVSGSVGFSGVTHKHKC